jgi:hypothetical protein
MVMGPRREVVESLVNAAYDGMRTVASHATGDEVISACVTLASRSITACLQAGANTDVVRNVLGQLMLRCADERNPQ